MLRKSLLALAAVAAIGLSLGTSSSAEAGHGCHRGGYHGGGGYYGGGHHSSHYRGGYGGYYGRGPSVYRSYYGPSYGYGGGGYGYGGRSYYGGRSGVSVSFGF